MRRPLSTFPDKPRLTAVAHSLFISFLVALLAGTPPTRADDIARPYLVVSFTGAEVHASINGIPAFAYGLALKADSPSATSTADLTPWLSPGDNVLTVELTRKFKGPVSAEIKVMADPTDLKKAPLASATLKDAGKATLRWKAQVPRWAFLDAPVFTGSDAEITNAVKTLHATLVQGDVQGFHQSFTAFEADMTTLFGDQFTESTKAIDAQFASFQVEPLPVLKIERLRDGRLIRVTGTDGRSPIRAASASGDTMELGQWWAKINGRWQVARA